MFLRRNTNTLAGTAFSLPQTPLFHFWKGTFNTQPGISISRTCQLLERNNLKHPNQNRGGIQGSFTWKQTINFRLNTSRHERSLLTVQAGKPSTEPLPRGYQRHPWDVPVHVRSQLCHQNCARKALKRNYEVHEQKCWRKKSGWTTRNCSRKHCLIVKLSSHSTACLSGKQCRARRNNPLLHLLVLVQRSAANRQRWTGRR